MEPENVDDPDTARDVSVPTLVICVCDELTDIVAPVLVNPVPAVRYETPST